MKLPVAVSAALLAAVLFGISTPLAKVLVGTTSATLLAGLLYLGSGIGLTVVRLLRDRGWHSPEIPMREWPWLLGAVVFGGIAAPILLMHGLIGTSGTTASLLLNLEAVFTACIAWFVFHENADRRIVLGMVLIVAGGLALSIPSDATPLGSAWSAGLIVLACLCWGIDNNLTRKVSASDALFIAGTKGWIAGVVNIAIAFATGKSDATISSIPEAMLIGFFGYGASLVLFVIALRGLGSARTGAYFSTAPFLGAVVAIFLLGEPTSTLFWIAAAFMAAGVYLHLSEHHEHRHIHQRQTHAHRHRHDEHHQHDHDSKWDGSEPHSHEHTHEPLEHVHAHFPDIHHQHRH